MESKLTFGVNEHHEYDGAVIAVEGIDNLGKSTVIAGLSSRLRGSGYVVTVLEEFGSDAVGQTIRSLVRSSWSQVPPEAQPLLIAADRYPRYLRAFSKLDNPRQVILCDRYLHSAIIYQAVSGGLAPAEMLKTVRALYGTCFRQPDLTLLLEASVKTAVRRGGTNIHDAEFLAACAAYLRDFSLGEKRIRIDAEAEVTRVLEVCEAAILCEIPSVTRAIVPSAPLDYVQSRYSGEVLFALCRGEEVFLQRKSWYPTGLYRIAGGGIENNESPATALSRELYEETGLALESLNHKLITMLIYNDNSGENAFVSYLFQINLTKDDRINVGTAPDEGFEAWKAFNQEQARQMVLRFDAALPDKAAWAAFRAAALKAYLTHLLKD